MALFNCIQVFVKPVFRHYLSLCIIVNGFIHSVKYLEVPIKGEIKLTQLNSQTGRALVFICSWNDNGLKTGIRSDLALSGLRCQPDRRGGGGKGVDDLEF